MTINKLGLIIMITVSSTVVNAQRQKFTFLLSNIRNNVNVDVQIAIKRGNDIDTESLLLNAGTQKNYTAKLKANESISFTPTAVGKNYHVITKTFEYLTTKSTQPNGADVRNVNIVEEEIEQDRATLSFGELLLKYSADKYRKALLDTAEIKFQKKFEAGTILIFDSKTNKLLEPFFPTQDWASINQIKIYNKYTGSDFNRVKKDENYGGSIRVPLVLKLDGYYGNNSMTDYIWNVKNYRQEVWFPKDKNPQSIFSSFKDATGYNLLKGKLKNDYSKSRDFKVYFVSTVCITEEITLLLNNYVGASSQFEIDFGLPAASTKIVKIGGGATFEKTSQSVAQETKNDVYNNFEVIDITESAIISIISELDKEKQRQAEEDRKALIASTRDSIKSLETVIIATYSKLEENNPNKLNNIDLILATNFPPKDQIVIPEEADLTQRQELLAEKANVTNYNNYRKLLVDKIEAYNSQIQNLRSYSIVGVSYEKVKEVKEMKSSPQPQTLSASEFLGIVDYVTSKKN